MNLGTDEKARPDGAAGAYAPRSDAEEHWAERVRIQRNALLELEAALQGARYRGLQATLIDPAVTKARRESAVRDAAAAYKESRKREREAWRALRREVLP